MTPRSTNQAADLASGLPLTGLPPAAAMTALQRQKLPRQPELLINVRKPFRRRPPPL